jgi:hypothetical protein
MILAAPLVIPFAKAVPALAGIMGGIGMAALSDRVNEYIQENPEESMKILSTIIPGAGIGQIFMSKEDKISLEDLEDMTDEEAQDLSKEDKAELMKQAGKRRNRELSIATSEKIGLSGPGKEKQDIEYEIDERYDEGGVEQKKAPFDYTKFFRKRRADGGAIGIEVLFTEKKPRKNFFMGGPALTGTALDIYNSMKAYGFPDAEIANALRARGLYDTTPAPTAPAMSLQPNITRPNGGGKDENDNGGVKDPFGGLGFSSANFGLGQGINKDAVMDYEADAYQQGRTLAGQLNKIGLGIFSTLKNLPTPFNLVRKGIEFAKQKELEKQRQEEAIARDLARSIQEQNRANRTGGYQSDFSQDSGFMEGRGTAAEMGSFKNGGLVSMFVEKK